MFAIAGIVLSVGTNIFIIRQSLLPLYRLRAVVDQIQKGQLHVPGNAKFMGNTDPDIYLLSIAIHDMLLQLEQRALELSALSKRAINAQEEERGRIARELHDDTSQALSILIIILERLESKVPEEDHEFRQKLAEARQLATASLKELRNIIYGLRPTLLDDLGLIPAIRWYAHSQLEQLEMEVTISESEVPANLTQEQITSLYRIAQEAINNIYLHAEANQVKIGLALEDSHIIMHVEDDGRGFDNKTLSSSSSPEQRLGLLGIQERADLIGGKISLDSIPGKGTRIEIRIPVEQELN
jgi:two-component system sensor histidine kinase UhpB